MWEKRLLVGKPEGKRPLGSPIRTCVNNIKLNLVVVGRGDGSGYEQVESSCEFGIEPSGTMKRWETNVCPKNWWSLE
jgi:hypothetical protein